MWSSIERFSIQGIHYLKYRNSQAGDSVRKTIRVSLIVDGRNIYDQNELADKGFRHTRIGKKLAE